MRTSLLWIALVCGACATNEPRSELPLAERASPTPAEPTKIIAATPDADGQGSDTLAPESTTPTARAEGDVPVVPIPNARQPLPGVITGGVPTDEQLQSARSLGYETVISLLSAAEVGDEEARVSKLGMRFEAIPIGGPADLTEPNAARLGRLLADPAQRPLILHCGSGNRVGALLALEAFYVEHVPAQQALELGLRAGLTSLRAVVEQKLGLSKPGAQP